MRPGRVAIACRRVAGVGGTTTTVLEHARRLSALGIAVDVFGQELDRARLRAVGARAQVLWSWPWMDQRQAFARGFQRAAGGRFDLVHGHGDLREQDLLSLHNCVHGTHESVHGRPLPATSAVGRLHAEQLSGRRFRLLIANSELMRADVVQRFGVPLEQVRVIYPGYDAARFRAAERSRWRVAERAALGVGAEEVLVGVITSGDFVKRGVPAFLAALRQVPAPARARMRIVIAGKEHRLHDYRALARESGWETRIRFLPPVRAIERLFHALDLYVHPAPFEEFGQSVQEALACGVPVLTGEKVGAAELMVGEARAWLLGRSDPAVIADRLVRLVDDQPLRARLGVLGPQAVAGNSWDANFAATLACYDQLGSR
ncbi:MAG TPA: glycosyltransferase family 4 protein [Candidatus Udaeobacter sp.]|nr:glycosyltransferase family 4 protein [Candidatus Udaeobacter sp.]